MRLSMDCRSDHSYGIERVKDHAFIVTKPLQLMVALSIMHQLEIAGRSHVIVVDAFAGARGVAERLAFLPKPFSGISVAFVDSTTRAYHLLRDNRFSAIFIDADVGFRKAMDLLRIRLNNIEVSINVYEEGLGTYRADLYRGIKRRVLQSIGIGTRFGGFILTDSLYLYRPDEYEEAFRSIRPKLNAIKKSLVSFIVDYFDTLLVLFNYTPPDLIDGKKCSIYLSNWTIDTSFVNSFLLMPGDGYIKPHPHIINFQEDSYRLVIDPAAPAEIAILSLLRIYDKVDVYHHGSSVERYVNDPRLHYIRV